MTDEDQNTEKKVYTIYIEEGMIPRVSSTLMEKLVRFLFKKVDFDNESLSTLNEYAEKGKVVYTSLQGSNTSLLIMISLLKRYKFKIPVFAPGYSPYLFRNLYQKISVFIIRITRFFITIIKKRKHRFVVNQEYIDGIIGAGDPMILSLLSKKLFLRRFLKIKTDSIRYLIESQKKIEEPVYIFPQVMYWNRNPESTKNFITSKGTVDRGLFSAFFTVFKSATQPFMRIMTPVNLKEEIAASSSPDTDFIARNVRNKLLEMFNNDERSILGPVLKTHQEMMEKVLYHSNVMGTIHNKVREKGESEKKLRKKAYVYYREIAADFSIVYIRFFEKALDYIFRKIFDGIRYNPDDFRKIREAANQGPLILMPSHKSHMDYLIISYVFFKNKLIPPHILAGSNLKFFPMGKIFRRSGAFFMRRSFKGMDLYTSVFKQYIKTLVNEGYTFEFFIEGGRSRTGKLVSPKIGIMKYLIESIDEGYNRDLMLVPVNICYDRILEENSYQKELKGKQKKKESTGSFFKSRKLLQKTYGSVYFELGEPFSFLDFSGGIHDKDSVPSVIGSYMIKKISSIVTVTPFSLVASVILFSSEKGFSKKMIEYRLKTLYDYLKNLKVIMSGDLKDLQNFERVIDYVIDAYSRDSIIRQLEIDTEETADNGTEGIYVLEEEGRLKINFYKNSIVHLFVPAALLSLAIIVSSDKDSAKKTVRDTYNDLRNLFHREFMCFELDDENEKNYRKIFKYFEKKTLIKTEANLVIPDFHKIDDFRFWAKAVFDYLESYLIVLNTVIRSGRKKINKKDLMSSIRKYGVKMYSLGKIRLVESLSVVNYNNALLKFEEMGILKSGEKSRKTVEIEIVDIKAAEDLRDLILKNLTSFV